MFNLSCEYLSLQRNDDNRAVNGEGTMHEPWQIASAKIEAKRGTNTWLGTSRQPRKTSNVPIVAAVLFLVLFVLYVEFCVLFMFLWASKEPYQEMLCWLSRGVVFAVRYGLLTIACRALAVGTRNNRIPYDGNPLVETLCSNTK